MEQPTQKPFSNTVREILCGATLTLAPALSTVASGGYMITLVHVGKDFGLAANQLAWTLSAFSLGCGSLLLLMGQISDTFGRKRVLATSYLLFAVFSVVSGVARSSAVFFALRGLQGVCAGSALPAAAGILGALYRPGKRRNLAMAAFSAGAPLGFVLGLVCGGVCMRISTWRVVPFFCGVTYAILGVAVIVLVPRDPALERHALCTGLKAVDYSGGFLALSGCTLFVYALTESAHHWKPYVGGILGLGVALLLAFVANEFVVKNPLMPPQLWTCPGVALCMLIVALSWMYFSGVMSYHATLYFQKILDSSPILTAAYYLPQAIGGILVNCVAAFFMLHTLSGRTILFIAMSAFVLSGLLWSFVPLNVSYWAMAFPALLLSVVGADLAYNVGNLHTLSAVGPLLQSSAAGVFNTILQLSSAVGLTAAAAISSSQLPNESPTKADLLHSYHASFYFGTATSGLALLLSFFFHVGVLGKLKADTTDPQTPTNEKMHGEKLPVHEQLTQV